MRKSFVAITLIFLFINCNKENLNNNLVVGKWQWQESVPSVSPQNIAAATFRPAAGELYILSLEKSGRYTYMKNGNLLKSGFYKIKKAIQQINTTVNMALVYDNDDHEYQISKTDSTMVLISSIPGAGFISYKKY